jgi:hypothetical protein
VAGRRDRGGSRRRRSLRDARARARGAPRAPHGRGWWTRRSARARSAAGSGWRSICRRATRRAACATRSSTFSTACRRRRSRTAASASLPRRSTAFTGGRSSSRRRVPARRHGSGVPGLGARTDARPSSRSTSGAATAVFAPRTSSSTPNSSPPGVPHLFRLYPGGPRAARLDRACARMARPRPRAPHARTLTPEGSEGGPPPLSPPIPRGGPGRSRTSSPHQERGALPFELPAPVSRLRSLDRRPFRRHPPDG